MSKQRYIRDEIWSDEWFFSLDNTKKIVWIFLLTNERCNVAGVYKLNTAWAASVLQMDLKAFEGVISSFEEDRRIVFMGGWLVLINFTKHQVDNPSVRQGIARVLATVPEEVIHRIQTVHSEGTDCSTLLNFTLLNFTSKEGSEEKSEKFGDEDLRLAQLLADLIKANNPEWKLRGKIETWAEHVEKLHRIDEYTYEQIEFMIRWTQRDEFWRQNILSTAKLRLKFTDLIPKMRASMMKQHRQQTQANKPKFA